MNDSLLIKDCTSSVPFEGLNLFYFCLFFSSSSLSVVIQEKIMQIIWSLFYSVLNVTHTDTTATCFIY